MKGKILIYRLSALGDVAMTIPAVYSLAEQYPELDVRVVTEPRFTEMFADCPRNISFMPTRKADCRGLRLLGLLWRLLRERADYFADFHNVPRSWLIDVVMRLGGVRVAMVDKRRWRRILYRGQTGRPFVKRYFDVLGRLGLRVGETFTKMELMNGELQKPEGTRWIGIAPFARYPNKMYPVDLMTEVVNGVALLGKKVRIFVFGYGAKESETIDGWAASHDNVVNMVGRYDMDGELRLMAQLDVMVSMDSANMHLASLVGTPIVSVWGSTLPTCGFLGWRQSTADVVRGRVECQPCTVGGSMHCKRGDYACLRSIPPGEIIQRVLSHLDLDRWQTYH